MNIQLYGPRNGSSLRVHWMLAELELPYESMPLDMRAGDHKKPEFLAINPAAQVPVINVDGFILAESMAITRYLAAKIKPELNGKTPEEIAKGMQWELFVTLKIQQYFSIIAIQKWRNAPDPAGEAKAREALPAQLTILDTYLGTKIYVAGDEFTTADINAVMGVSYAGFIEYDLSLYKNIQRWMNACTSRPAYISVKG